MPALDRHTDWDTIREPQRRAPDATQPDNPAGASSSTRTASGVSSLDLLAAAQIVLASPQPRTGQRDEIERVLDQLVDGVERRTRNLEVSHEALRESPLARPLLARLRLALAQTWVETSAPPAAPHILAYWNAFDAIERDLAGDGRSPVPDDLDLDFSGQLSGPRGLDLVVEVAHDLRSPLTSILFLAETLQRGQSGTVNDLQRRQLGLIYSAALGLSTLASNVMELARGGSRLAEDSPAPFSVRDVFESVADIVRPMAEEKGLTVRLLPPGADHRLGPSQAIARVLLNLTTNAIKFTEEGFVELVAKCTGPTTVEFSVRDTGRGINPDAVDTLFRPFRSGADGSARAFSGTGLGLALCRKLVEAMDAELHYETSPDWGTRFFFSLDLPEPLTPR